MTEARNNYLRIDFVGSGDLSNAVISPDDPYLGPYWTLIGAGTDDEQNAVAQALVDTWNTRGATALLREAAALFREYERHHRAKITEAGRPEKAERNRDIAERIEAALAAGMDGSDAAKDRLAKPFTGQMTDERRSAIAADILAVQTAPDPAVDAFLDEVRAELIRARAKFPGDRIMTIALAEEFGELCKAVLDEPRANVRKEAVQTAVMAARVVLDGDGSVNAWRAERGLDPLVDANGTEEGDICGRNGCAGVLEFTNPAGSSHGCTCFRSAPCGHCLDMRPNCPACGWDAEQEHGG